MELWLKANKRPMTDFEKITFVDLLINNMLSHTNMVNKENENAETASHVLLDGVQNMFSIWGAVIKGDYYPDQLEKLESLIVAELRLEWGDDAYIYFNQPEGHFVCNHPDGRQKIFKTDALQFQSYR